MGYFLDRVKALKKNTGSETKTGTDCAKSVISAESPTYFNAADRHESVLGMPVNDAIEAWRAKGAPVIHLRQGENCFDLGKLLRNPNTSERHLAAVKAWLEKQTDKPRGES